MVKEIIHIQVGKCGNYIGTDFWDTICAEHHINEFGLSLINDEDLLSNINVCFRQTGANRYTPRAVLVDLEPGPIDMIKNSRVGKIFPPDNFCFGHSPANIWAKGHYTEGAELIDEVIDIIRRETEYCDCPQGFQIMHSIGGGTGSGLGTLILIRLRDNYPDRMHATHTIYPSTKVSDVITEPYNAQLSMHQLIEESDITFVYDNEALWNIAHNILKVKEPMYSDLNWIISLTMASSTSSFRFKCEVNNDLRKMGINLVPFPRAFFMTMAQAPIFNQQQAIGSTLSLQELTQQMWSSHNLMVDTRWDNGRCFTAACIYRGNTTNYKYAFNGYIRQIKLKSIIPSDIMNVLLAYFSYKWRYAGNGSYIDMEQLDQEVFQIQKKISDDLIAWIPQNIKTTCIDIPTTKCPISGTIISNTTAIKGLFQKISSRFAKMYKRRAMIHWYKGEGMDDMEFQEADKNVRDLIMEYQDWQDVLYEQDDVDIRTKYPSTYIKECIAKYKI